MSDSPRGPLARVKRSANASAVRFARRLGKAFSAPLSAELRQLNAQLAHVIRLLEAEQAELRKHERTTARLIPIGEDIAKQTRNLEAIRARVTSDVTEDVRQFTRARQLSLRETLDRIIRDELSFARFGDGEFRLLTHPEYRIRFQPNSPDLQDALRQLLTTPPSADARLLLGFPSLFRDLNGSLVWSSVWPELKTLIPDDVVYGNSHVTRPLVFQLLGQEAVELWRAVWKDRTVRIITGKASRFELIPELFDNLASSEFLHTKPVDAFSELDDILRRAREAEPVDLHLVALGPAGTLVTARLAQAGLRAIDVGHISDSYLNVVEGAPWPESKPLTRREA